MRVLSALDVIVYKFQLSAAGTVERRVAEILVRKCCFCCYCCFVVAVVLLSWLLTGRMDPGTSCFPLRLQVCELLY